MTEYFTGERVGIIIGWFLTTLIMLAFNRKPRRSLIFEGPPRRMNSWVLVLVWTLIFLFFKGEALKP